MSTQFKSHIRPSRSRTKKWAMLCSASAIGVGSLVWAASPTYVGPNNGLFSTPGNWSTGVAPNSGDVVSVGPDEGAAPSMNVNFDYSASMYSSGGFSSLFVDSASISQNITLTESPSLGHSVALETGNLYVGEYYDSAGTFVQGGLGSSTNTITGDLDVGGSIGSLNGIATGGPAEYDLSASGGTISVGGGLNVGIGGFGASTLTDTFYQSAGLGFRQCGHTWV
jgi:hypothetical protein